MTRKMKDSGVEWIGEIPEEWKVVKVKRLFHVINGATPKSNNLQFWNGNITWITPSDMSENIIELKSSNRMITSEGLNSCGTTLVPKESIIISNRAPIGQIGIASKELCTNQGCKALIMKKKLKNKYYFYFMVCQKNTLNMLGRGTTFLELSTSDLSNFIITFPKLAQQTHIVNYLDTKCTKIDQTIDNQKQVIEKLKEYKQSIITEAVTKGLNPNVKMKDSGVEWIGEIPEDWRIIKIRFIGELSSSGVDKKIRVDQSLFKSVHFMDVMKNSLRTIGNADHYLTISTDSIKAKKCLLKKGDVLFTNSSETPDDIGHSTVVCEDLENTLYGYHLMLFRPNINMNINFEKYLFGCNYIRRWFEYRSTGITRYGLSRIDFSDAVIFLPTYDNQHQIANYLDKKCSSIDKAISKKQQLIDKLTQYKKSLIYECVTGKKEVNNCG